MFASQCKYQTTPAETVLPSDLPQHSLLEQEKSYLTMITNHPTAAFCLCMLRNVHLGLLIKEKKLQSHSVWHDPAAYEQPVDQFPKVFRDRRDAQRSRRWIIKG